MYIVEVIPITKGAFKSRLSFFSKESLSPGMVVSVPIRGKKTSALVIDAREAREDKLSLRKGGFALKKLDPTGKKYIFPPATIRALHDAALLYAVHEGVALERFTPSVVIGNADKVHETKHTDEQVTVTPDRLVLQAEYEDRIRTYRNITRESFARGQSVTILAPTIAEAENLYNLLSRGIEEQVVLATSALSKKNAIAVWNRVVDDVEPLLCIITHSFLTLPRENLSTLIIERESARSYLSFERTRLDARIFAEEMCKNNGARIVYADFPLRVETRARLEMGEVEEVSRLQISSRGTASARVIDARTKEDPEKPKKKRAFSSLTDGAGEAIRSTYAKKGRTFIYVSRLGLATLTVCNDCETPIVDPTTGTPMTLHKTPEGNIFLSHRTGAMLPAHTTCKNCGSWNLVTLGIGVDRVAEDVQKLFPEAYVLMLTSETASTHAKARKVAKQFFSENRTILIGTERALPYLEEPVELSIVASIDGTLSSSAWRAHEHALHTLFFLKDRTQDLFIVQTRMPETAVMKAIATGNPTEFYRDELEQRVQFGYPPATTFIGLTWTGTERAVEILKQEVEETLKDWELVGPLPPRLIAKNRYLARAVIRLPKGVWPEEKLAQALRSLSSAIAVSIDPDEIV
ncbi:hypothetical protein COU15_01025 [Candidatus Kaiserbacteria bacterium CG10_big_fil_rev_8_21_14_0_10_45_20]|uniref:Primosomal protein N' 3' DNA-binding domain-containing protein n=1 Tax=Candidatus Kaiserbacteria bacterium CG10_big_fil_rev_8_21_14_0_10_45_20 TaxID=1974607 RepID=A0A2H0UG44_9BACT|nr:MAG: hypothetical protein COU15_01025 [Candidatus Kaiserbacteria bacterium CG10_big_fil_rev_8_21_14_0_10_45_20]